MTLKHKIDLINGILAPKKNIGKVVLHMVLVQIGAALFGGGHIGFCANRPLEGDLNLLGVVLKTLCPYLSPSKISKTGHKVHDSLKLPPRYLYIRPIYRPPCLSWFFASK